MLNRIVDVTMEFAPKWKFKLHDQLVHKFMNERTKCVIIIIPQSTIHGKFLVEISLWIQWPFAKSLYVLDGNYGFVDTYQNHEMPECETRAALQNVQSALGNTSNCLYNAGYSRTCKNMRWNEIYSTEMFIHVFKVRIFGICVHLTITCWFECRIKIIWCINKSPFKFLLMISLCSPMSIHLSLFWWNCDYFRMLNGNDTSSKFQLIWVIKRVCEIKGNAIAADFILMCIIVAIIEGIEKENENEVYLNKINARIIARKKERFSLGIISVKFLLRHFNSKIIRNSQLNCELMRCCRLLILSLL